MPGLSNRLRKSCFALFLSSGGVVLPITTDRPGLAGLALPSSEPYTIDFENLKNGSELTTDGEAMVRVSLIPKGGKGLNYPKKFRFTFLRDDATLGQAGQFDAETVKLNGGVTTCQARVIVPRKPGRYILKVEAVPYRTATRTPEESVSTSIKIMLVR